ncbi:MAG TPA: alpha-glucan family phosphorylase, partial [Verrucomicrobiae bacterium]|nr:alpha-glucan family phosphorylase [Verrucomicrobiae bacterium]
MEVKVAYFSAEFGIDQSLPIYSGGLGVLAGDHVKAANDLGLSLVGVGILYRKGYFTQRINSDGNQEVIYSEINPANLPVVPVMQGGKPLIISVTIANRAVHLRVWCMKVGLVPVYLMDADLDINEYADRRLTDSLYGGDQGMRISQEIILGIGGVKVLRAMGIEPEVWHLNEGHVAFLTMELMREYYSQGVSFYTALEAVKASTIFTTHTPVPAGHDVFSFELVRLYLGDFLVQFDCKAEKLLELGQAGDRFNMTRFAVRTSSRVNGVSKLHAKVTRELFHHWTPEIPSQDIPVDNITNGIHTRSWLAPEMKDLFDRYLNMDWEARVANPEIWQEINNIPDNQLWQAHQECKRRML